VAEDKGSLFVLFRKASMVWKEGGAFLAQRCGGGGEKEA